MAPSIKTASAAMPLLPVALLLGAGIVAGRYTPLPLGVWVVAGLSAWTAGVVALSRRHLQALSAGLLAVALAAIGACMGALAWRAVPLDHIAAFMPAGRSPLATVTGRIATVPQQVHPQAGDDTFIAYRRPPQTQFLLDADGVSTDRGATACAGTIGVYIVGPAWDLHVGQRVRIAGRLSRPGEPRNPGQHDRRSLAQRSGTLVSLSAEADEAVQILRDRPSRPGRLLWRLRAHFRRHLQADADHRGRLLLGALIFGQRDRALQSVNQAMMRAGVAHFLSISGLHLGVLLGFVYLLLRVCQAPPRMAAVCVLIVLGAYLLVAEPRTPLLRAGLMAAAFCLAVILGRSANTANLLAGAAVVLLAADPTELFRPCFQLSFGIVGGILVLYRPVRDTLFGRWLNRRGLMVFRDDERLRRWLWYGAFNWFTGIISLSVSAYLASVPLVAYHFGLLTPLAPLTTLLLFPFVSVTLIVGYVQVALTPLLPNLAAQLAPLLGTLADGLTTIASGLQRWPLLSVDLYPVPAWAAALMAVGIVVAARHRQIGLSRAWACVVLMAAATTVIVLTQLPLAPDGEAELAVLDVRHGVCVVLRCPSGRTVLLDAGSRSSPDVGQRTLLPFLRHRRWPTPTRAFLSHANLDHYNALPPLLKQRTLRQVFLNDYFGGADDRDDHIDRLMDMFARSGTGVVRLHRGRRVRIDDRTAVTVLWPPPAGTGYDNLSTNDSSLVLRLDCHGKRVLLPGDVQHLAQRLLLELPVADLRADVLILPHHGSFSPALAEFIDAVDPQVVIRSAARRRTGAVEQIRGLAVNRHFFSTDADGCITVRLADDALRVRGFASARPPVVAGR